MAASSTAYPNLGNATWKIVGSTATVDARDNTGTNPSVNETGVAVFLMDGATVIANNHADLWNGISAAVSLNENGDPNSETRVFTGTLSNGTKVTGTGDQPLGSFGAGLGNIRTGESSKTGGNWMTDFNAPATQPHKVFALSNPLSVIASNTFSTYMAQFPELGTEIGFADDPDGDGIANGLEAWFGTHPGAFNAGLAVLTTDGTTTTITHPQNPDPPADVTGFYQWSINLADWYAGDGAAGPPGGPTVTLTPGITGSTTTVTVIASAPLGMQFVRIEVTQG